MNHSEAVLYVGDLVRGNLPQALEDDVLSHVQGCEECRALSRTYLTLSEAFLDTSGAEITHPASDEIVDYALGGCGGEVGWRQRVAEHASGCPTCALEIDTTRRAEIEARSESAPVASPPTVASRPRWVAPTVLRRWAPAAAAAAAVFALMAYPAYRGLGAMRGDAGGWSGPVEMAVLLAPLRSPADVPTRVVVDRGQPHVPLAVIATALEGTESPALRFAVEASGGHEVWSRSLSRDAVLRYAASSGAVTFLLPASTLPPGAYDLRVLEVDDVEAGQPLLEIPFEVVAR